MCLNENKEVEEKTIQSRGGEYIWKEGSLFWWNGKDNCDPEDSVRRGKKDRRGSEKSAQGNICEKIESKVV